MAKRQLQLTEKEIGQFREVEAQTRDVHELKRLQAIRLYGSGVRLADIQDLVHQCLCPINQHKRYSGIAC